jgi:hypothetical protein
MANPWDCTAANVTTLLTVTIPNCLLNLSTTSVTGHRLSPEEFGEWTAYQSPATFDRTRKVFEAAKTNLATLITRVADFTDVCSDAKIESCFVNIPNLCTIKGWNTQNVGTSIQARLEEVMIALQFAQTFHKGLY